MTTLAFIGCAHIHTPGFIKGVQKRDGLKVKSVWDHDPSRAKKRADELKAQVVDDFKSIYADSEIDGVIICSETNRHEELIVPAAEAAPAPGAPQPPQPQNKPPAPAGKPEQQPAQPAQSPGQL